MMEKKIVEITNGRLWYEGLEGTTFLVYDNRPGSLIIAEDWDRDDGNYRIIGRHDCQVVENHVNIAALEAELAQLRQTLKEVWDMADEDIREGTEGSFTGEIEAKVRAALKEQVK